MIIITLENIKTLNNSLQVGDMIYAAPTQQQVLDDDIDFEAAGFSGVVGDNRLVGILRRITIGPGLHNESKILLDVDNVGFTNPYIPNAKDFIMFSKWDQIDGDVNGYYAKAIFKNNSKLKVELFSVGSEIIINSK